MRPRRPSSGGLSAAGLQLGDVDFLRRTLTVERQIQGQVNSCTAETTPNYDSARVIYLPDDLVTMLSRHIEHTAPHGEDGYLFSLRGYIYNRNSAGNQWRRIRKQVGMDEFTLHDLRHFYASSLIAAGCDVVTVQHALGHSSPSITLNTYSHLWPKGRGTHPQRRRGSDVGGRRREIRKSCGLCADSRQPIGL